MCFQNVSVVRSEVTIAFQFKNITEINGRQLVDAFINQEDKIDTNINPVVVSHNVDDKAIFPFSITSMAVILSRL